MTYNDLLLQLESLKETSPEVLMQDVTVTTECGEYFSILKAFRTKEDHCDVLDDGHLVLAVSEIDFALAD